MSGRANLRAHDERVALQNAAREEDLRWMIETGECLTGAAARLGVSVGALEKWLARRGMFAEGAVLRGRDPFDPAFTASERGKLSARWAS